MGLKGCSTQFKDSHRCIVLKPTKPESLKLFVKEKSKELSVVW